LHEAAVKHGHLALSAKKSTMKWRSKKAAQKLKYCIEKTCEVIFLSIRRERQIFLFVLCHVGRNASNIQRSTSCIEHVQILTQSPFITKERTMKELGVSNHFVKKAKH